MATSALDEVKAYLGKLGWTQEKIDAILLGPTYTSIHQLASSEVDASVEGGVDAQVDDGAAQGDTDDVGE